MALVHTMNCPTCGDAFTPPRRRNRTQYCSRSCASRAPHERRPERHNRWDGGKTRHPLYATWLNMIARCERVSHPRYADWGGRGIKVCNEWRTDFWRFAADVGPRPEGCTLDRVDNDDGYRPGNVRWATPLEQSWNSRRWDHHTAAERAEAARRLREAGATYSAIAYELGFASAASAFSAVSRAQQQARS